ncbi:MAG: hypothetical protein PHH49_07300 [Candidatus Omnitrophica bacterium]|nr:hypothetical protein [Candidatus Omnitrophota bacterium]MDD5488740.1 hypothetical protein [Candidatus Omnitrophota bacterium]
MPYESNLDETLFAKTWESEGNRLTVSVRCYNKGPKKLQISRESAGASGDMKFAKLGRLTKEEAEAILPLMQEALSKMD